MCDHLTIELASIEKEVTELFFYFFFFFVFFRFLFFFFFDALMASIHVHVIVMAQSIPSVPIPFPPTPPGICLTFVFFFKCPMVGPKNRVQMLYLGTTPKLHFPVKKLQIPYLWETYNNLIKLAHEAPYTNRF